MQNQENTIQIQNGRTEKMQQSTATSLAFNLFIDGRDGFFYTNKLDAAELFPFIRQAVETTRLLEPDESRTLARRLHCWEYSSSKVGIPSSFRTFFTEFISR